MSESDSPLHLQILKIPEVKLVNKPRGWERWIVDGEGIVSEREHF